MRIIHMSSKTLPVDCCGFGRFGFVVRFLFIQRTDDQVCNNVSIFHPLPQIGAETPTTLSFVSYHLFASTLFLHQETMFYEINFLPL